MSLHAQTRAHSHRRTIQSISSNSVKVLSKACEMFVLELTMRSYQAMQTGEGEGKVLTVRLWLFKFVVVWDVVLCS